MWSEKKERRGKLMEEWGNSSGGTNNINSNNNNNHTSTSSSSRRRRQWDADVGVNRICKFHTFHAHTPKKYPLNSRWCRSPIYTPSVDLKKGSSACGRCHSPLSQQPTTIDTTQRTGERADDILCNRRFILASLFCSRSSVTPSSFAFFVVETRDCLMLVAQSLSMAFRVLFAVFGSPVSFAVNFCMRASDNIAPTAPAEWRGDKKK